MPSTINLNLDVDLEEICLSVDEAEAREIAKHHGLPVLDLDDPDDEHGRAWAERHGYEQGGKPPQVDTVEVSILWTQAHYPVQIYEVPADDLTNLTGHVCERLGEAIVAALKRNGTSLHATYFHAGSLQTLRVPFKQDD